MLSYGFRIVGGLTGERRLVNQAAAFAGYAACIPAAKVDREGYLSAFSLGDDFKQYLESTGSTKGFGGQCWAPWLWWDIDIEDDLPRALIAARTLALAICKRFELGGEDILVFFSGSKGFHLGLPTVIGTPEPSVDFHRIARKFCETLAATAGVPIDVGVYDKVRAFRAPNSLHPKTGLHKRRMSLAELVDLDVGQIAELARNPQPYEIPSPAPRSGGPFDADWAAAKLAVHTEAEAIVQRRAADVTGEPRLNQQTLHFIREGADGGERATRLYSAARNLADFGCPSPLAHALLTESALDSGLPPFEVRRQIECGITDTRKDGAQ